MVSKVLNDSLPQKTDSLLAFKECVLIVNPLDYFLKNKISVYNLSLKMLLFMLIEIKQVRRIGR